MNSDSLLHVPIVDALRTTKERLGKRTGSVSPKPPVRNNGGSSAGSSPRLLPSSTVTSASVAVGQQHLLGRNLPCLSVCSAERTCSSGSDAQAMAQWSVEDVCSFVASVDICAEYAPLLQRSCKKWFSRGTGPSIHTFQDWRDSFCRFDGTPSNYNDAISWSTQEQYGDQQ